MNREPLEKCLRAIQDMRECGSLSQTKQNELALMFEELAEACYQMGRKDAFADHLRDPG